MAGIDNNTLFLLRGDSFSDSSYRNAIINRVGSIGDAQIVDEVIDGKEIKCIYFNTTGYFTANIDSTFLKRPFCIDWWEKDYGVTSNTSGASLLGNMTSSTYSFGLSSWTSSRNCISMSTGSSSYNIASVYHIGATKLQEWVHRAVEFDGSAYNFYENGKLYSSIKTTNTCYTPLDTWYFNRWRGSNGILNKKIYNMRISSCMRYGGEFEPNSDYYEENNCTDGIIYIEKIDENATLYDILEKSLQLNETYSELKLRLAKHLRSKGVSVRNSEPFQSMVSRVKEIEREGGIVLDVVGDINESGKEGTTNDFNVAVTYKLYDVVSEDASQLVNTPVKSGKLEGVLKVYDTPNFILQVLETVEGETYKRILTTEWSEWKQGVSGGSDSSSVDLSNYFTKAEIEDKMATIVPSVSRPFDFIITDKTYKLPLSYEEVNKLRPTHRHKAICLKLEEGTFLAFTSCITASGSNNFPTFAYASALGKYRMRLEGDRQTTKIFKLIDGAWIDVTFADDSTSPIILSNTEFTSDTVLFSEVKIFNATASKCIAEKPFCFNVFDTASNNYIITEGSYLIDYNGTIPTKFPFPEGTKKGILTIKTIGDGGYQLWTLVTNRKIYMKFEIRSNTTGTWNEVFNSKFDINSYYTKTEIDNVIQEAMASIDLSALATKEEIAKLASKDSIAQLQASFELLEIGLNEKLNRLEYIQDITNNELRFSRIEKDIDNLEADTVNRMEFIQEVTNTQAQFNGVNKDISNLSTGLLNNSREIASVRASVNLLSTSAIDGITTFEHINGEGMPEIYNYTNINGLKVMWVNVKMSENEYNMAAGGLLMKTLNLPEEVQIFDNIIMANITSYCRESNNTLSRIVQNAEIISNTSLRGRWRHTDNTYPRIDRFTILCFGI